MDIVIRVMRVPIIHLIAERALRLTLQSVRAIMTDVIIVLMSMVLRRVL